MPFYWSTIVPTLVENSNLFCILVKLQCIMNFYYALVMDHKQTQVTRLITDVSCIVLYS